MSEFDKKIEDGYKTHDKNVREEKPSWFGKPIPKSVLKGDIFSGILKDAGYLPDWITLQKEIHQEMGKCLTLIHTNSKPKEVEEQFVIINEKIKKYNRLCPTNFQRVNVDKENIEHLFSVWK
jgi:hypothetical protein